MLEFLEAQRNLVTMPGSSLPRLGNHPARATAEAFVANPEGSVGSDDFINPTEIVNTIWRSRYLMVAFAVLGLLLAAIVLHMTTFQYEAVLRVTPVPNNNGSNSLSDKLGGISGIASLAGVDLDAGKSPSYRLYLEELHSREVAEALFKRTDLMKQVFEREWDPASQTWRQHTSIIGGFISTLGFLFGTPQSPWQPPDAARLEAYIDAKVKVEEATKSPVATITFYNKDPVFAVAFLSALNAEADRVVRKLALARTSQYIAYLAKTLETTTTTEQRTVLLTTLSDQESAMMMASSSTPYAAEPLGAPAAPDRPTYPPASLILLAGAFAGILVGLVVGFLKDSARKKALDGTTLLTGDPYPVPGLSRIRRLFGRADGAMKERRI